MAAPPTTTVCSGDLTIDTRPTTISLQEWQAWGTDSPIPTQVDQIVNEMIVAEKESDAQMKFGGLGGKLKVSRIQSLFPFCGFCNEVVNFMSFCSVVNNWCFLF